MVWTQQQVGNQISISNLITFFLHRVELSFSFDFPSFLTQSFDLQGIEPADPETFFKNSTEVAKKWIKD